MLGAKLLDVRVLCTNQVWPNPKLVSRLTSLMSAQGQSHFVDVFSVGFFLFFLVYVRNEFLCCKTGSAGVRESHWHFEVDFFQDCFTIFILLLFQLLLLFSNILFPSMF